MDPREQWQNTQGEAVQVENRATPQANHRTALIPRNWQKHREQGFRLSHQGPAGHFLPGPPKPHWLHFRENWQLQRLGGGINLQEEGRQALTHPDQKEDTRIPGGQEILIIEEDAIPIENCSPGSCSHDQPIKLKSPETEPTDQDRIEKARLNSGEMQTQIDAFIDCRRISKDKAQSPS